jgi:hypothetical protein
MLGKRIVDAVGAGLLAAAFLFPPGDAPWVSFWREWVAAVAILLIVLGAVVRLRDQQRPVLVPLVSLPALALCLAVVPWLQWVVGIEFYRGDAILVSAYLVAFAVCIAVAQSMVPDDRALLADRLAAAMLFAALCSVPLAALQWAGMMTLDLGIKVVAGRPVAHMEQTNLLCTLLLQGLAGAWRLFERKRLGGRTVVALGIALLLTADLTQSRVAWLVLPATTVAFAWRRRSLALPNRSAGILAGALVVVLIGGFAVPWIDAHLGLTGMALSDRLTGGRRPDAWWLFLDAVRLHPLAGWGPLQNGAAQFAMAPQHPALLWLFGSAHDVVLDLMVWFGAPIGLLAGAALVVAVLSRVGRAPDAAAFASALAALALLMHGLVELPLQYVYFLLPLGLLLGIQGLPDSPAPRGLRLAMSARASVPTLALVPALLLAALAHDYVPLCDVRPFMDYDKPANHMLLGASADVPDVLLLDQLQAFQAFAARKALPGLSPDAVASLRKPMLRFPFAPSQEHYAHLVALNGEPAVAVDALQRSCLFMTVPQCAENRRAWAAWRSLGEPLPAWP